MDPRSSESQQHERASAQLGSRVLDNLPETSRRSRWDLVKTIGNTFRSKNRDQPEVPARTASSTSWPPNATPLSGTNTPPPLSPASLGTSFNRSPSSSGQVVRPLSAAASLLPRQSWVPPTPTNTRPASSASLHPASRASSRRSSLVDGFPTHSTSGTASLGHPEHRSLIRTAISMLCKEMAQPPLHMSLTASGRRDWQEVEVRMRALTRMERVLVWGKTEGGAGPRPASGIGGAGEEYEQRLFTEALKDGFVLCQLMNKLHSSSIIRPNARDDGFVRSSNMSEFLAACSSYGLPRQDLFQHDDLIEATSESLARVARTIIVIVQHLNVPTSVQANQESSVHSSRTAGTIPSSTLKRKRERYLSPNIQQLSNKRTIPPGHENMPGDIVGSLPFPPRRSLDHNAEPQPRLTGGASERSASAESLSRSLPPLSHPVRTLVFRRRELGADGLPASKPTNRGSSTISLDQRTGTHDDLQVAANTPSKGSLSMPGGQRSHRRERFPSDVEGGRYQQLRSRLETNVDLGDPSRDKNDIGSRDSSHNTFSSTRLIMRGEGKAPTHLQLGDFLGRGQFFAVYRALNLNTGHSIAVKRISLDSLEKEEVNQLAREVDLLMKLSHPCILKYEGMARDNDALSIVLEYAENGTLYQALKAFGKLNERVVATCVIKILEGLQYLHSNDVVHCNLKAANILTTKSGHVKLSDFGFSLHIRALEQGNSEAVRALNWTAPEIIELKRASPKSDIWSLACTVVELLTGRPPYPDIDDSASLMSRIVEDDMPPFADNCSLLLEDFLKQCFNKDPTKRPSAELLHEHEWLQKDWGAHHDDRQDNSPVLIRPDAVQLVAQPDVTETCRPCISVSSPPSLNTEIPFRGHSFVKTTFRLFSQPMVCRGCSLDIKKSAVLCEQCGFILHSKCARKVSLTCDLRARLLPYTQYEEDANPCREAYTQLSHWQRIFEAQTKEQIAACPDMDDELIMLSPSESAAINVYEHLMLFLFHSTQDNRLRVVLGSVATFVASLDPVWSFVRSAQVRIQLFRISSILNISDGEQLRTAVAKDESALGMLLHQIIGTEREKKRLLRLKEENAQCAIDLIQDILDKNLLYDVADVSIDSETLITKARRLLVRLSEASDTLPASLFIRGILQVDKEATFGGAFGDIYRASYKGQHVALKRMRVHVFQRNSDWHKLRRRLCREALLWQRLQNPFVLPFTGIDTESFPSFLCLVSPWMKHGTILKHLAENGNANVEQKLLEIAKGLLYLHSQDVVHGDLRGSNILVDDNWQVRLADFGLAGFSDATVGTQTSHRGGSVRWMSPELHLPQSCGLDSFQRTFASDAYSFACVCLELIQGKPPFFEIKEDMAVVLRVLAKERPARPQAVVSNSVWSIMQPCWAHDPAQRPSMARVVEMMQETMNI
uniref:Non-specific serine/threonine protein kinase n=1 Tax=Mycena chlorophos TaxID=658473 RepID=A0ABQ0L468_MYCCL|nr:predicted protein [Mycena chlorophos]